MIDRSTIPYEFQHEYRPLLTPWFCELYASKIDRIGKEPAAISFYGFSSGED